MLWASCSARWTCQKGLHQKGWMLFSNDMLMTQEQVRCYGILVMLVDADVIHLDFLPLLVF